MTNGEPNPGEGASEAPGTPIQLGERTGGRPETPPLLSPAAFGQQLVDDLVGRTHRSDAWWERAMRSRDPRPRGRFYNK